MQGEEIAPSGKQAGSRAISGTSPHFVGMIASSLSCDVAQGILLIKINYTLGGFLLHIIAGRFYIFVIVSQVSLLFFSIIFYYNRYQVLQLIGTTYINSQHASQSTLPR